MEFGKHRFQFPQKEVKKTSRNSGRTGVPHRRRIALVLAAALLLGLALALAGCSAWRENLLRCLGNWSAQTTVQGEGAAESDAAFAMHFIDVGQALSVLVTCDGESMVYDGGNVDDGSTVVAYLLKQGVTELKYVFNSHAHEDHVGGLAGVLAKFPAGHVYAPVTEASTTCFKNFVKYTRQQGLEVEVPTVGTVWQLGSATVRLVGPVGDTATSTTNNTSLVLRIDYGSTSFLLTGDMEQDAEKALVASDADLDVDVLQVGHHGSYSSSSYRFLNAVLPEIGIISVGEGNDYGHPHESTLSRLRDADVEVYRTDLQGDIVVYSDGKNYTVATERTASSTELNPTLATTTASYYIGNKNSMTFHLPTCENLPAERNQVILSGYDAAIREGYTPCASCMK
jgi:beta-lactamase superfamily II metal-dependent hydrolase